MPILAFHNCSPDFLNGFNNYTPKRLEDLLINIKKNKFKYIGLSDYIDNGQKDNDVVLTFDDGYDSFYNHVYPILDKLSIPATVCIPTDFIGLSNKWDYSGTVFPTKHLSENQIKELSKNNMTIVSHGLAHRCLTQMTDRLLNIELKRSKEKLENIIERKVSYISYPFGRFNKTVESAAINVGYRNGLTLSLSNRRKSAFTLSRSAVYAFDTPYSVINKINRSAIERIKGIIMNGYAGGTIFLNSLRGKK